MTEKLHILIAGIPIRLEAPRGKFTGEWKRALKKYIAKEELPAKITVRFIEESFPQFRSDGDSVLIRIVRKQGNMRLASVHISLQQFYWILSQVVLEEISKKGGFFLHCSAVLANKGAMLFLGPSGSGKSTISYLLKRNFPKIVDDQAIILKKEDGYRLQQMFYPEKNGTAGIPAAGCRIFRIFFIKKSGRLAYRKTKSKTVIMQRVAPQLTTSIGIANRTMANLIKFVKSTDDYGELEFNRNRQQANLFFRKLTGEDVS